MAVFSSLFGSGNVLAGPTTKGLLNRSPPPNHDPISMMSVVSFSPPSSPSLRMKMSKEEGIEAVSMARRESVVSSDPNLFPIYRGQSAAAAAFDYEKKIDGEEEETTTTKKDSVTSDQMDHWIRESIGEIVMNIGEAPFLVQIFSQGPSALRLETEEASPERWPLVKKRWEQSSCTPDGVILVEELKDKEEEEEATDDNNNNTNEPHSQGGCSRRWGLLVQVRGMDCAASCYILNTCRVRSSAGFCTHFCLVRAKCFGETIDKQLSRAWLQGR